MFWVGDIVDRQLTYLPGNCIDLPTHWKMITITADIDVSNIIVT